MLRRIALGLALFSSSLVTTAWADDALNLALFKAISDGNVQEVQSLISRGADVSVAVSELKGKNPPYNATAYIDIKGGPLMVAATPFSYAMSQKNKEISRLLARNMVKFAVPVTWGDDTKSITYPLRFAVADDDVEITEILLQRGANINDGAPLFSAVGSTVMADFLLAHGANVNAKNADGEAALHQWGSFTTIPVAEWLLAHGADISAKDAKGRTPLHAAVLRADPANVKFLLEHRADVNAKDNDGATPMHLLGSKDFYHSKGKDAKQQLIELLISRGADVNAKDKGGQTPLSRVTATADQDLIQALQAQGGKSNIGPRELFLSSVAQFKDHSDNETLRISIIDLALKLKSAPPIPPEADAATGRAAYIFKNAKSDDDTLRAAKEYLKAIEVAPWVANYYYNLCTVLEKTPFSRQALHACKLYLVAGPNAVDTVDMQQSIAGLQYAVDKDNEQIKQRTLGQSGDVNELYQIGGLSGQVSGKNVWLKLSVDWQAAPPKYQVMSECDDGSLGGIWTQVRDLVSADTWITLCSVNMHLVIKPDGAGFVQLGDANTGNIRTTLDELFNLRRKTLERSTIFSRDGKTYVGIFQGGKTMQYAGLAMYESNCNGNQLRQDARALPDDFVTAEMNKAGKSAYYTYDKTPCTSQFADKTGYSFRGGE